jgi:COP9 signalosome complex subunit 7
LLKLRQLSLLTLAKNQDDLTYKSLLSKLELSSVRELEDLVISCIYANLISGTLDPYNQRVSINSVSPLRDLSPGSVPSMISTLKAWDARCASTLATLEQQIEQIKEEAKKRYEQEKHWKAEIEEAMNEGGSQLTGKGSSQGKTNKVSGAGKRAIGSSIPDVGEMDIDEVDEDTTRVNSKKRGAGVLGN